jgi:lipoyl-dependent peroxiredoxin
MQKLYTTTVHATGDGRNGHVQSDDGLIDTDVRHPKELGGSGDATNPEQLFAAGYSACFHSALRLIGQREGVDVTGTEVSATISLGMLPSGGFGIAAELDVAIPTVDRATAESLVAKAHEVCPYSNATRGNIDVVLTVV